MLFSVCAPCLNFFEKVSSTLKYVTWNSLKTPFLHFSFHDNSIVAFSARWTSTSGLLGTAERKKREEIDVNINFSHR